MGIDLIWKVLPSDGNEFEKKIVRCRKLFAKKNFLPHFKNSEFESLKLLHSKPNAQLPIMSVEKQTAKIKIKLLIWNNLLSCKNNSCSFIHVEYRSRP